MCRLATHLPSLGWPALMTEQDQTAAEIITRLLDIDRQTIAYLCREGEEQSLAKRAQKRREILVNETYCSVNASASIKMASVDRQTMCTYMLQKNRQPFF